MSSKSPHTDSETFQNDAVDSFEGCVVPVGAVGRGERGELGQICGIKRRT